MSSLPVSPIVPTSSGPAAQAGVVEFNLNATTGQIVTGAEFGYATSMGDINHDYTTYGDPSFQALASQYPTDLLRHNWELNTFMDVMFPSRASASAPNFTYIDNFLSQQGNLKGFFNNQTGTQIVTLGFPSWLDISNPSDQQLYANMVKGIAQHFIAMGEPIGNYELVNEPDGHYSVTDMANTFNVVAQALKSVDSSYKLGGLAASWGNTGDLQTFFQIAGPNIGFVSWHQYVTSGSDGKSAQQAVTDTLGLDGFAQTVRAEMQAAGIPNSVPLFLGEYNVDGGNYSDPNNGNMVGAAAAAATTYAMIHSDSNMTMGAAWDVMNDGSYQVFGGQGNYHVDPVGVVLANLTAYMPGNLVQTTMPGNTPGLVGYTTEYGQGFSVALIDTNLSQGYTVDLSHDGLPTTGLFRVEVSNANPQGMKTAIIDLSHVSVAAGSVVIITDEAPHGGVEFTGGTGTGGTTPPPPAPVTTGSGSDTLVLSVSEDAYANGDGTSDANGDAAFTVSVDGKQLGGTFTTTALHTSGVSQSFTFKGDWAPGAHAVAVNFLNDAWGGSAATDRNLYVNGITYDGTATGQSAELSGTGPQNFSVTDSTAVPGATPPPPPTPSPDGTKITTAAASPIIDQAGNKWTLVQSSANGLQIAINGVVDKTTSNVTLLETLGGKIVQENASGDWYSEPGASGPWSQITNPTPPPPPPTPSPDGTKITTAAANPIIDQAGNKWTLVQSASNGLQIAVNGTVDATSANVALLETLGGKIVQENTAGNWYSEPGPTGPWSQITNPTPPPVNPAPVTTGTGSDTLVLSISEDAYQGNAQFTVSVDGKQLAGTFATTASHASGATQSFTFKGDWAAGAHAVAVNFLNDANGGTPATDRNLYVNAITYDGKATGLSAEFAATGAKSFSVTDTTAIPAAAIGSGADTLVIGASEDAYLGNAQFTVSVDGKQLGGTLTATASHAAAANQNFTFKGDFGTGAHAVAVNFLNDAWGGSAATDRNLYVNAITYNGAATGQSATLGVTGPQAFSVTGGTAPSVSETGDHGALAKTLSQTGSYTVGGDTFVLTTGNAASVTLGTGTSQIKFIGASSATLTGGSGQATVTADAGSNKFVAGTGTLDVTGGGGKDAYVFHANGGLLKIEDFSIAKGDTLTVDKALQGSLTQASDGRGGTMLTFGAGATHGVDIHGMATMPTTSVLWA